MALPQETDAWRRGQSTGAAMLQELKAQEVRTLYDAREHAASELASARRQVARAEVDGTDPSAAKARQWEAASAYEEANTRLDVASHDLQMLQDATAGETLRARQQEERRARIRARRAAGAST
jgi:hypothetical protein